MLTFALIFLTALVLATATKLWLGLRHVDHIQRHREDVPAEFSNEITLDAHHRAADYSCAKTRLGLATTLMECALILALTYGGGLNWAHEVSAGWFPPGVAHGVALLVLLGAISSALDLPFACYRTFGIEQRFGFNKMTPRMFVIDLLKNMALAAALGIPLIACILWVMERAGALWWLYA
jgi:STE24 endopeptidase